MSSFRHNVIGLPVVHPRGVNQQAGVVAQRVRVRGQVCGVCVGCVVCGAVRKMCAAACACVKQQCRCGYRRGSIRAGAQRGSAGKACVRGACVKGSAARCTRMRAMRG